jgi:anthranilate synthase component II
MILLIDNYDSFTYNLYQYLGEIDSDLIVKRNDSITLEDIKTLNPEAIVISPGPGRPEDAGICIEVIQHFYRTIPILGICLGHQAIAAAFNANIISAKKIMHGKTSELIHHQSGLFKNEEADVEVMRYHSLAIEEGSLPSDFEIHARAKDDGEIMAIKHQDYPLYGLQFHPESIGTKTGKQLLRCFIQKTKEGEYYETIS